MFPLLQKSLSQTYCEETEFFITKVVGQGRGKIMSYHLVRFSLVLQVCIL